MQYMQWKHLSSSATKKAKVVLSARKKTALGLLHAKRAYYQWSGLCQKAEFFMKDYQRETPRKNWRKVSWFSRITVSHTRTGFLWLLCVTVVSNRWSSSLFFWFNYNLFPNMENVLAGNQNSNGDDILSAVDVFLPTGWAV